MEILKYISALAIIFILFSCEEVLFEPDISEERVTLIAPANNTEIAANSVRFNWEPVDGATEYGIQIATPSFANANQLLLNMVTDSTFYQMELVQNEYEWRVRAQNSGYATPYASAKFRVAPITDFSGYTVILLSPPNGTITNEETQTLTWEEVPGATQYRVQVLDRNGQPIQSEATTANSLEVTFPEGSLQWQVRAEKNMEFTLYSARNILVDMTAPNVPILTEPEDGEILTEPSVSFDWTRTLIAGSVESDSIYVYRDPDLTDLVLKDVVTAPFETTLESNETYYWYMEAFDEAGNMSGESGVRDFSIEN